MNKEYLVWCMKNKGITKPCPRCDSTEFEMVGMTPMPMYEDLNDCEKLRSGIVACVIVACSNCGFITLHHVPTLENKESE